MPRPRYTTIVDELGMKKSMPARKEQFEWFAAPDRDDAPVVFLGLGPEPDKLPEWFDIPTDTPCYFLESEAFIDQVDGWENKIPQNFKRITIDEFTPEMAANSRVARYLPAQRAFPTDFAPLTAKLLVKAPAAPVNTKTVWLPVSDGDLLCRELAQAFAAKGYSVVQIDHEAIGKHPGSTLPKLLAEGVPDLFFSVNFKGLDHFGLGNAILREAGVKVGVWFVDNPFNVLPAVKSPYWRDTRLFVTDHTFIGPLIGEGAKWVTHLPLATSPSLFETDGTLPDHAQDLDKRLVFVGRSEFPDREKFFAGETIDVELVNAVHENTGAERLDYHWWREQTGIAPLWPGNQVRGIGVGAEWTGRSWKFECLRAAGPVTIFGDTGWKDLDTPDADLRGPVDYYDHLPAVYRSAAVTLNATGMQLPAGLTQRHFDVWCAGGFLISDANPGLQIFPEELVAPIRYSRPEDIRELFLRFREETAKKARLRAAWKECILHDHTYTNRIDTVITGLGL